MCGILIHASDFTGGAKTFEVSKAWSMRVNQEFAKQFELEGKLGLEQSLFMRDLDKIHILAKAEIGFFRFLVQPLWTSLGLFMEGYIDSNLEHLSNAMQKWNEIHDKNKPE